MTITREAVAPKGQPLTTSRQSQMSAPPVRALRGRRHPERWFAFVAVCLISIGFIFPLIWMLSTSLKTLDKTMANPPKFIPEAIELHTTNGGVATWDLENHKLVNPSGGSITPIPDNYWRVINHDKMDFPQYTRNTLMIALLRIVGTVLASSLAAYGFARIQFKGRSMLFGIMLSTMMIPFAVLMVPYFSIFRWLGDHTPLQMLGTLRPLWLTSFFGSAFSIFLLRQFYMTIPSELSEAARIDGCNEFGIWWRIMLPLSRPALAVVALFTFLGGWNDFLGPLIYVQDPSQYTLALGLQVFQSSHGGTEWNLLMAASLLILSPVILLFFLTQKTFIQGIATTGMKG